MINKMHSPGRHEPECWGLEILRRWDRQDDQRKCDDDSVLLLRLMYLIWLATESGSLRDFFLEHPEDPNDCSYAKAAKICSSIWVTKAILGWLCAVCGVLSKFDQ